MSKKHKRDFAAAKEKAKRQRSNAFKTPKTHQAQKINNKSRRIGNDTLKHGA
jgi:hypothetical protein